MPVGQEHVSIDVKEMPSEFYKAVLGGSENTINRWWVAPAKK